VTQRNAGLHVLSQDNILLSLLMDAEFPMSCTPAKGGDRVKLFWICGTLNLLAMMFFFLLLSS